MTTEDDSSRIRRGKKGRGRVEEGGFGKKIDAGKFSPGRREHGRGWEIVETGTERGRHHRRKDTCQQPLNVGTCASSVTRYQTLS